MRDEQNMKERFKYAGRRCFNANGAPQKHAIHVLFLAALLTFFVGVSQAQNQVQSSSDEQQEKRQVAVNLQDADIRVLINAVAEVTGKNFIVDPRVKGKVSLISGAPLDEETLYDVFLSILEVHNFATVETGNVVKVLPGNQIKQRPTRTLFAPTEESNDEQITQIIRLNYAPVQDLVPIIRPLIPPTSHFAPHQASNSVVITDTAANIQRVLAIVRKIDVPDKRASIHLVNLRFAVASDMAATLTQLVTATTSPQDGASSATVSIQAYDSTNSLLISASEEQFVRIQALIDELDVETKSGGDVQVIPLKHSDAADLAGILRDLNSGGTADAPGSEFLVQADEASNSLVVKGSAGQLQSVQGVIDKLDKRRAQVFVETVIAEITLTQAESLGINWTAGLDAPIGPGGTDAAGAAIPGAASPRLNTVGSRAGTGQTNFLGDSDLGTNGGLTYSLLDFGRFGLDVTVNALRNDTDSNILSTPTLLTLDNEEAEIIIGQEVPFLTGGFNAGTAQTTGTTDAAGNPTNTAINSFQTIERQDVGIVLRITPQINEGDTVTLEVFQEISDVIPATLGSVLDQSTNRRSIEATVQVEDGQVIALGGLIQDDLSDTTTGVPFLSRLPLIGALFRSQSKSSTKSSLVVFLKPTIIRTPDQLIALSKEKYDDVRRDAIEHRNRTDGSFLLNGVDTPVLVDYDKATDEFEITSEELYIKRSEEGDPKVPLQNKIKNIIFGRTSTAQKIKKIDEKNAKQQTEFKTEGGLEQIESNESNESNEPETIQQSDVVEPISQEPELLDSNLATDIDNLEPVELPKFEGSSKVLINGDE